MEKILELDGNILLWIQNNLRNDFMNAVMKFITMLGDYGIIWIVIGIIMLIFKPTRKAGAMVALALISNFILLNLVLKNAFSRIRPYEAVEGLTRIVPAESSFSFPSGHAGHAFATGVVMLVMLPRRYGVPAIVLAALISLSRLYVGVHYPTDVFAGCVIGTIMAVLSILTVKAIDKRKNKIID